MIRRRADSSPHTSRAAAGFTLIEVLAALVIVALGMLGVIEAVTQQARNGTYLREKTLAHWIAMNVVTEQRLQSAPPPVADSSDDLEFAGERWHWNMRVSQTQVDSLRRIDVTVRPASAKDDVVLASVSGFYGTAIGPAGGGAVLWNGSGGGASGLDDDDDTAGGVKEEPKDDDNDDDDQPPVQPPADDGPPVNPSDPDE